MSKHLDAALDAVSKAGPEIDWSKPVECDLWGSGSNIYLNPYYKDKGLRCVTFKDDPIGMVNFHPDGSCCLEDHEGDPRSHLRNVPDISAPEFRVDRPGVYRCRNGNETHIIVRYCDEWIGHLSGDAQTYTWYPNGYFLRNEVNVFDLVAFVRPLAAFDHIADHFAELGKKVDALAEEVKRLQGGRS